jgi:hypothetical protein
VRAFFLTGDKAHAMTAPSPSVVATTVASAAGAGAATAAINGSALSADESDVLVTGDDGGGSPSLAPEGSEWAAWGVPEVHDSRVLLAAYFATSLLVGVLGYAALWNQVRVSARAQSVL